MYLKRIVFRPCFRPLVCVSVFASLFPRPGLHKGEGEGLAMGRGYIPPIHACAVCLANLTARYPQRPHAWCSVSGSDSAVQQQ